jgi:hypothetical protein
MKNPNKGKCANVACDYQGDLDELGLCEDCAEELQEAIME